MIINHVSDTATCQVGGIHLAQILAGINKFHYIYVCTYVHDGHLPGSTRHADTFINQGAYSPSRLYR